MLIVALMLVSLQEAAPSPSPAPAPAAKASPAPARDKAPAAPTKGERKYAKGSLGGLDLEGGTVRFVDENGRSQVWSVDRRLAATASARAEALLKVLEPGQPITVVYHEDEGHPVVLDIKRRIANERQDGDR